MLNKKKTASKFLGFTYKWRAQIWYNSVYAPHTVCFRKYFNFCSCYLEQTSEIKEWKLEIKYTSIFISKEIVHSHAFSSYLTTAYIHQGVFFTSTTKYRVELNPKVACKNSSSSLGFAGGSGNFVLLQPGPPRFWVLLFQPTLVSLTSTAKKSRAMLGGSIWYDMMKYRRLYPLPNDG